jgi:hypothetical protein
MTMMIRQRRVDEDTDEEPSESEVTSTTSNDDDSSDEVIEAAKDEDSKTSGSDDEDHDNETGSTGDDDTEDEDEKKDKNGDDANEGDDKQGDDANEGDDKQGDDDNENDPNVGVEEIVSNDGGKEVDVIVEEKVVTDDKVSDDDVENDTKVDGDSKSEDDDFALELVEEELQEYEELESEYGSSWGDDFLADTTATETSFNDDQMNADVIVSTANESFVAPSNDANLNIISLPSTHSGTTYKNEHWNYLIAAVLLVCGVYALSKFFAPTRATKFQRRRDMGNHKRLPTIEDDDSSA